VPSASITTFVWSDFGDARLKSVIFEASWADQQIFIVLVNHEPSPGPKGHMESGNASSAATICLVS
jgi:hypothetical protein